MADKLRFALMGLGNAGAIYVRALNTIPDAELVGVIDLVPERLEAFAKEHNITHRVTDPTGIRAKNHERIIADLIQAISEDREPLVDPASARRTSELVAAIYKSSREGKTVELEVIARHAESRERRS